jgi:hypothetical protein
MANMRAEAISPLMRMIPKMAMIDKERVEIFG